MAIEIPVRAQFDGGDARRHLIPAYDGFTSLAGLGLTLSLTAHYAETAKIRRRGDFLGRQTVKANAIQQGSVVTDFLVLLPKVTLSAGRAVSDAVGAAFYNDLLKRVLDRNLGIESEPQTDELSVLLDQRGGDVEALVAATEPSVKQSHSVIGEGAEVLDIFGGRPRIASYDVATKQYVNGTIVDRDIIVKDVSVAAFNVNTGYGGVFDFDLGRVVSMKVAQDMLPRARAVLGWGLNEYANGTGARVSLRFYRHMAFDGRPKKYIVVDAEMPKM